MVEARYQGKPVSSLPEEVFAEGLSRSGLSPVLLLASPITVPVTTDERWWLAKENVSGHYGRIFYAAVRELVIRSDIMSVVRSTDIIKLYNLLNRTLPVQLYFFDKVRMTREKV